ncbi:MAG: S-methyl-5-thioribose-1-phosphate isomerase [Bacteroidales bacterium]|nr:S-methyl-5-thioribose-1-phosphate isomerase [Bacteroidales bacterium]
MRVNGAYYQSVWADYYNKEIYLINQTLLPFRFEIKKCLSIQEVIYSIQTLEVRGAPALGLTAAYAMWLSFAINKGNIEKIKHDYDLLINSRPTAVNLKVGADKVFSHLSYSTTEEEVWEKVQHFVNQELTAFQRIGLHGFRLIYDFYVTNSRPVNILTHCNAGWLACGDYGTALAPIFEAHRQGIPVHVWVDETRPLNQGARLTAWELYNEKIPFHIIADNTSGQLMLQHKVDLIIVGADRIVKNGDTINKIGTYLKALAAYHNHIPFYVAAPLSTFDFDIHDGQSVIIEERNSKELHDIFVEWNHNTFWAKIFPYEFPAYNLAFDVTPASFITAYITEKGIFNKTSDVI